MTVKDVPTGAHFQTHPPYGGEYIAGSKCRQRTIPILGLTITQRRCWALGCEVWINVDNPARVLTPDWEPNCA